MIGIHFVGLCHFCDVHGPAFIWCTERGTYRSIENAGIPSCSRNDNCLEEFKSLRISLANSEDEKNTFCMGCSPKISSDKEPALYSKRTVDDASEFYISSSYPVASQIKPKQMKELSIRSLSNEVSPSKEDPVIFSDGDLTVLSLTFHLKDFNARGYKRLYGLTVVSDIKYVIMGNVEEMMEDLNQIKKKLCDLAEMTFAKTAADAKSMVTSRPSQPNFLRQTAPSNLCCVVNDDHIFEWLHIKFCRILDKLSSGLPPVVTTKYALFVDEDLNSVRRLASVIKPKVFSKLLYLILTTKGSVERILFDEKQQIFASWPEKLVCSLRGTKSLLTKSKTLLSFSLGNLEEVVMNSPTKDSVFVSRLTRFFAAENTTCRILESQLKVFASQIHSLLEVFAASPAVTTYPGLKDGDIEIIQALSQQ